MDESGQRPADEGGQPQYGRYHQPEYGAMAGQYPAGYDPYVYGRPDPEPTDGASAAAGQPGADGVQGMPQQPSQYGQPGYGQPNPYGWNDQPNAYGQNGQSGQPNPYGQPGYGWNGQPYAPQQPHRIINGIDVDDPASNPFYGKWDLLAVMAFVCALFLPIPLLPTIMGAISMKRVRVLHMRGFWLAFAAVAINVFYTIMIVWLAMNGMTAFDLYQEMLSTMMGGSGGSDGSITA
ncbi:hypothetical protein [Bifidobacterium samirii]|uniref:DUF4190 domain-containing protein n=1 Tax=Bifidobacterium samirii TaxID=2306974 RepID=A0A430FTS4_9BIFI|nr:hypothetical protein [Bifidobacterium samirii]RSX56343.1 hypothetical protein D2E24_1156 [Bifidobacterium samirii]